jgi:hypothetical protein
VLSEHDEIVSALEKSPSGLSDLDVPMGRTSRATDRTSSAADRDEDQTDRLQNQKVREVSKENQMFDLLHLELERKVRGEILQARFSMQEGLEDGATDHYFEQTVRDEELAALLQDHSSRFSNLAVRLLEQKVRDPILQGLEEEEEGLFSNETRPF